MGRGSLSSCSASLANVASEELGWGCANGVGRISGNKAVRELLIHMSLLAEVLESSCICSHCWVTWYGKEFTSFFNDLLHLVGVLFRMTVAPPLSTGEMMMFGL